MEELKAEFEKRGGNDMVAKSPDLIPPKKKKTILSGFGRIVSKSKSNSENISIRNDKVMEDLKNQIRTSNTDPMADVKKDMARSEEPVAMRIPYPTNEEYNELMEQNKKLDNLVKDLTQTLNDEKFNQEDKYVPYSPAKSIQVDKLSSQKSIKINIDFEVPQGQVNQALGKVLNKFNENDETRYCIIRLSKE